MLAVTFAAGVARMVLERRRKDMSLMLWGTNDRQIAPVVLIAVLIGAPIFASGGFDSPALPIIIPLCFFYGTIASPRVLVAVTLSYVGVVALLALISAQGLIDDLMPVVFGGGSGLPASPPLLYAKAVGVAFTLGWAALVAHLVQEVFRKVFSEALDARDEVLKSHDEHTRELTALSGELAHELKNPLANVRGLAVLVGRDVHGKGVERLEVLQHEVERMEEILHDFLTFSRPLSPLNAEVVDLPSLCASVLTLHEGVAASKGMRLSSPPTVGVSCDPRKVKQILINLVQNALEASPPGAEVELVVRAEPGHDVVVEIRDRGTGLSPAVRERLFEPGTTTKARGTGLGLALARGLARQHGGDLTLENREDGGCVASLRLPALTPTEERS